jgi:hypothetical protein
VLLCSKGASTEGKLKAGRESLEEEKEGEEKKMRTTLAVKTFPHMN